MPFQTLQSRGRAIKALAFGHDHDLAGFKRLFKKLSLAFYSLNNQYSLTNLSLENVSYAIIRSFWKHCIAFSLSNNVALDYSNNTKWFAEM